MSFIQSHKLCAGIIVFSSITSVALAQAENGVDESSGGNVIEILVVGETYRHTATKSLLPPEETPQSVSVIDHDTLIMRDVDSINEALRYVPGVNTELRGGAVTRIDQFNIRGFANYQNAYDGLPLLFNGWNLQPQIDAFAVQQVEVFKGPTSSLYGNMPPGGFVNLISKQPGTDPFNQLALAVGTNSLVEASFESRGAIGRSDLSYSVVGLGRQRDGQAVTSEEERYMFSPSVDWALGDNTVINFNLFYQADPSAGIYNTVPAAGSVFGTPFGQLETDFYAGDANWNTYDRTVVMPGYKINHEFENGWRLLHQARYMDAEVYQENTYNTGVLSNFTGDPADARILLRRAYLTDETAEGLTIDNQFSRQIQTGAVEHNVLLGVDYQKLKSDIRYEDAETLPIDLFAPNNYVINPASLDFAASGFSSSFDIVTDQVGIYVQDQLRIGNWIVIAGGRHDQYNYEESGIKYGFPATSRIDQDQFSGRVGVLYELASGWSPYLSFSESFEPTGGSDRNGNTFDPATADQWELGVKYGAPNQPALINVAVFQITKENDLTRDPNGSPYDLIQAGETRSRGLELETHYSHGPGLRWMFNYTWLDVEVTKDNSGLQGKTPVWIADHAASFWVEYDFLGGPLKGVSVTTGVRYVGETQLDSLNTGTVPDYTLVDLAFAYDLGNMSSGLNGATARLSATNIGDERYFSCYDGNNCWFGAERTVELGLNYTF